MDEQFERELLSGMKATGGAYWCFGKEIGTALFTLKWPGMLHMHTNDVACKREVLEDNNNVTSGPATGIETAALLERRPESRDETPEVQRPTESMRTVNEFLQVHTQSMGA